MNIPIDDFRKLRERFEVKIKDLDQKSDLSNLISELKNADFDILEYIKFRESLEYLLRSKLTLAAYDVLLKKIQDESDPDKRKKLAEDTLKKGMFSYWLYDSAGETNSSSKMMAAVHKVGLKKILVATGLTVAAASLLYFDVFNLFSSASSVPDNLLDLVNIIKTDTSGLYETKEFIYAGKTIAEKIIKEEANNPTWWATITNTIFDSSAPVANKIGSASYNALNSLTDYANVAKDAVYKVVDSTGKSVDLNSLKYDILNIVGGEIAGVVLDSAIQLLSAGMMDTQTGREIIQNNPQLAKALAKLTIEMKDTLGYSWTSITK